MDVYHHEALSVGSRRETLLRDQTGQMKMNRVQRAVSACARV